jgi:signal transduction histidine kinase
MTQLVLGYDFLGDRRRFYLKFWLFAFIGVLFRGIAKLILVFNNKLFIPADNYFAIIQILVILTILISFDLGVKNYLGVGYPYKLYGVFVTLFVTVVVLGLIFDGRPIVMLTIVNGIKSLGLIYLAISFYQISTEKKQLGALLSFIGFSLRSILEPFLIISLFLHVEPEYLSVFESIFVLLVAFGIYALVKDSVINQDGFLKNAELEKIKKEKEAITRELELFLSLASHELQTPVAILEGYTSALEQGLKNENIPRELKEYPELISKNARILNDLIQSILQLGRANSRQVVLTPVDFNAVLSRAVGEFVASVEPDSVDVMYSEKFPAIFGSEVHLTGLLKNIFSNAYKYSVSGKKPVIKIEKESEDKNSVVISISDNGIGIPQDKIDSIFFPMVRLYQKEVKGYGLGLTYVKKVVDIHKGDIWVKSGINHGTAFYLRLRKVDYNNSSD